MNIYFFKYNIISNKSSRASKAWTGSTSPQGTVHCLGGPYVVGIAGNCKLHQIIFHYKISCADSPHEPAMVIRGLLAGSTSPRPFEIFETHTRAC